MKLGTHQERMAALEDAFDKAGSGIEKATIVDAANRMDRENQFADEITKDPPGKDSRKAKRTK